MPLLYISANTDVKILETLFETHKFVLPQWDFSIGLGSDILTTLHFYAIGDPLDLLSIACPAKYAAYLYSLLSSVSFIILRGLASAHSVLLKSKITLQA